MRTDESSPDRPLHSTCVVMLGLDRGEESKVGMDPHVWKVSRGSFDVSIYVSDKLIAGHLIRHLTASLVALE